MGETGSYVWERYWNNDLDFSGAQDAGRKILIAKEVTELLKKGVCSAFPIDGARRAMAGINAQIPVKGENF